MRQVVPADENGTAQRNVRDPSVYLFVNEENETGNLILGLCFPMAPPAAERPHLETGESGDGEGQAWHREDADAASWAPATAGSAGWIPRHHRASALLLMKKGRRSKTAGKGQLEQQLPDTWRPTSWGGGGGGAG